MGKPARRQTHKHQPGQTLSTDGVISGNSTTLATANNDVIALDCIEKNVSICAFCEPKRSGSASAGSSAATSPTRTVVPYFAIASQTANGSHVRVFDSASNLVVADKLISAQDEVSGGAMKVSALSWGYASIQTGLSGNATKVIVAPPQHRKPRRRTIARGEASSHAAPYLALGLPNGRVLIFNPAENCIVAALVPVEESAVVDVAFCADGERLLVAAADGTVSEWNLATLQAIKSWQSGVNELSRITSSPDDSHYALAGYTVSVYDAAQDDCVAEFSGHTTRVNSLQFAGQRLVTSAERDRFINVWFLDGATNGETAAHLSYAMDTPPLQVAPHSLIIALRQ